MCELEDWADAVVGNPSQGLNIELRKRLTIGVELAAKVGHDHTQSRNAGLILSTSLIFYFSSMSQHQVRHHDVFHCIQAN